MGAPMPAHTKTRPRDQDHPTEAHSAASARQDMDACCSVTITQRSSKQLLHRPASKHNLPSTRHDSQLTVSLQAQAQVEHTAMLNRLISEWQIERGFFSTITFKLWEVWRWYTCLTCMNAMDTEERLVVGLLQLAARGQRWPSSPSWAWACTDGHAVATAVRSLALISHNRLPQQLYVNKHHQS